MPSNKELLAFVAEISKALDVDVDLSGENGLVAAKKALLEKIAKDSRDKAVHASPLSQWTEHTERDTPPEGIEDPQSAVVQHLLSSWSTKAENVTYITNWLISLKEARGSKLPTDFPMGLQLVSLDETLKDNFLAILIPAIDVHLSIDLTTKVYVRRRLHDLATTTLTSDMVYDLRFRIYDLNAPNGHHQDEGDAAAAIGAWWEGNVAPTLQSVGDSIISSPVTANIMSLLPASWSGSKDTSDSQEIGPREVLSDNERRARDREWSSQAGSKSPDDSRNRINSADAGTGRVGVFDQAPHRAMRSCEVDLIAYDLDASLEKEEEILPREPRLSGAAMAAPAAEHKKAMVEAKLRLLRDSKTIGHSPPSAR